MALVAAAAIALAVGYSYVSRDRGGDGEEAGIAPGTVEEPSLPRLPLDSLERWREVDDPRRDGWESEAFTAAAGRQLARLGDIVLGRGDEATLEEVAVDGVSCSRLRPARLETVFEDGGIQVDRPAPGFLDGSEGGAPTAGRRGLLEALRQIAPGLRSSESARCALKIVRVEESADAVATRQLVTVAGPTASGRLQQNAVWEARWTRQEGGEPPRLLELSLESFEEVRRRGEGTVLVDTTASVLSGNATAARQLFAGFNHWLERIQDNRFFALLGTPGLALGDVDGDGLDDLYLCQEGGLPNRLFLQREDGRVEDISERSGADWIESSRSALLVDLDNDGDQDLAVAVLGALVLASGDGSGRFSPRAVLPTSHDTMSLSAADVENDGDLDLYVCAYKSDDLSQDAGVLSIGTSDSFVYHDANNGAPNLLLRNESTPEAWRFTDITEECGLDVHNRRFSFAAAWEDFDLDGDQDLYVANDFGRNTLYRNDTSPGGEPRFVDVAGPAGAEDSASGMSVTWGDYDRDGRPDLYVSNMFSAAGGRVTHLSRFKSDAGEEVRSRFQRFARGNTLLRNGSGELFQDASVEAGVTMGRWAWSSNFVDLDNDGWEDVVVANGYVTTEDTGDL